MGSSHGKASTIRDESIKHIAKSSPPQRIASDGVENSIVEEKEDTLKTKRRQRPNPRLSKGVPNGIGGEQVAAGWPNWLVAAAGEAINGWIPRRADSFEKIDKIGQGTYSNVYKGRDLLSGKLVALKKVRFDSLEPDSVKFMAREIIILRKLGDHPNVIRLEGLVTSKMSSSLYLVFELMEYDLRGLQECSGVKFSEPEIKCYMNQLLKGLDHCHSRGILHRDITTSNMFVDKDGVLKIADFGLSTFFEPEQNIPLTSRIVTLWYRPPELLLGSNFYGIGVDLWGVGCVLGELFTGKPIMTGRTEVEQMYKIYKLCGSPSDDYWKKSKFPLETIFKPQNHYRPQIQEMFYDLPEATLALLQTLLSIDPEDRGTATLSLQSEFFRTEPYACDQSSLLQHLPGKEMGAKLQDARRTGAERSRDLKYRRDRNVKAIPAIEANAELARSLQGTQLFSVSEGGNRLEETTPYLLEDVLKEEHESHVSFQEFIRNKDLQTNAQSFVRPHQRDNGRAKGKEPVQHGQAVKGKKNKHSGPLPAASKEFLNVDRLLREHDQHIQESVERAKLQKKRLA